MVTYLSYEFNNYLLTLNSWIAYQRENMYNTSTFILSSITHDIINMYICIAKLTASAKLIFYQNIIIFSHVKHDITKIGNTVSTISRYDTSLRKHAFALCSNFKGSKNNNI